MEYFQLLKAELYDVTFKALTTLMYKTNDWIF